MAWSQRHERNLTDIWEVEAKQRSSSHRGSSHTRWHSSAKMPAKPPPAPLCSSCSCNLSVSVTQQQPQAHHQAHHQVLGWRLMWSKRALFPRDTFSRPLHELHLCSTQAHTAAYFPTSSDFPSSPVHQVDVTSDCLILHCLLLDRHSSIISF